MFDSYPLACYVWFLPLSWFCLILIYLFIYIYSFNRGFQKQLTNEEQNVWLCLILILQLVMSDTYPFASSVWF